MSGVKLKLNEIRKRAKKATSGAWNTGVDDDRYVRTLVGPIKTDKYGAYKSGTIIAQCYGNTIGQAEIDAEFIAHARTDVPNLVAALHWAIGQIETYQELYEYPYKSKKHEDVILKILSEGK